MGINELILLAAGTESGSIPNSGLPVVITGAVIILAAILIGRLRSNRTGGQTASAPAEPDSEAGIVEALETPVQEEEDLSDDLELVAVITAAICAYEEAEGTPIPADGLIVRSIRRVNKSRWQNA